MEYGDKNEARRDLFVVARVLERLRRAGGPLTKTKLQIGSNLNYDRLQNYLAWLIMRELVAIIQDPDGTERVSLTTKGAVAYTRLVEWLEEFVVSSRSK